AVLQVSPGVLVVPVGTAATADMRSPDANVPSDCANTPNTFASGAVTAKKTLPLLVSGPSAPATLCRSDSSTPLAVKLLCATCVPPPLKNDAASDAFAGASAKPAPYWSANAATTTRLPSFSTGPSDAGAK